MLYESDYSKAVQISPDGRRYLVVLYRGDIERNGNWVEFFAGSTQSMRSALDGRIVARLFTTDYEITRFLRTPVWLADSERVAFVWNDGRSPGQVVVLNLRTGKLQSLTRHPKNVEQFDISLDGNNVVYTSVAAFQGFVPRLGSDASPQFGAMLSDGFAVADTANLTDLLNGYPDNRSRGKFSFEFFTLQRGQREARRIDIDGYVLPSIKPSISPNGRWAVVMAPPTHIPDHWSIYEDSAIQRNIALKKRYPDAVAELRQLWLIDVKTSKARPLWDVPYVIPPAIIWSADSAYLTVKGTVLPVGHPDALSIGAVEFDIAAGQFRRIALAPVKTDVRASKPAIRIELREDENTPPLLVAIDEVTGVEQTILDWNAQLRKDFTLGRVELISWRDPTGRAWSGRLYYPVDFAPERRYPLVILTAPRSLTQPRQFSLRGPELTASTVSIAQPLANRNIFALVMSQPDDLKEARMATPEEGQVVVSGYESAIAHLVDSGLVERERVGLAGYSRGGFYVQYTLTHSQFPFRAAASADNVNQSYLQYLLVASAWARNEFERVNGAAPYAGGLQQWLANAPGFNVERIRTPLRLETNNGGLAAGLLNQWEIYSHLRALGRPVELYVIPDIEHGSHGLVRPLQQLASLGGSTDWMDFWLTGAEDPEPRKAPQYARWRKLRLLKDAEENSEPLSEAQSLPSLKLQELPQFQTGQ